MFKRIQSFISEIRVRRMVRRHIVALKDWDEELHAEAMRLQGVWHCLACKWEGGEPDLATTTWELEDERGRTPRWLERIADCPRCGTHEARLGGDPVRPIPAGYPLGIAAQGPCPSCGSQNTIPIIRGYPTNDGMLAASRGQAKLGGCLVFQNEDGTGPALKSCKDCGHEWCFMGTIK
jgi:hypothetical protein